MLICPQCQFENPNSNKFCQNCGASLTSKVCLECKTNVPLNEERCQHCGAETGMVWQAIISTNEAAATLEASKQVLESTSNILDSAVSAGAYLDQEQRYKLLEPLPPLKEPAAIAQVRVLDCKPLQLTPLEVNADSVMGMEIPALAKTYLVLQPQLHEALPAIHDAWQQGKTQVVLIAVRSNYPELIQLWQDHKTTQLQILHWLYEMTQLWETLEPFNCRQSLLELFNLRVDEDGVLGLQRLYTEPNADKSLTLQDLG
jgi:protein phosphatase